MGQKRKVTRRQSTEGYPVPLNRDEAPKGKTRFDTGRDHHQTGADAIP